MWILRSDGTTNFLLYTDDPATIDLDLGIDPYWAQKTLEGQGA